MKDQRRKEDPEAVEGQLQFALQTDSDPMATDLQVKEQVSAWLGLELMWGATSESCENRCERLWKIILSLALTRLQS